MRFLLPFISVLLGLMTAPSFAEEIWLGATTTLRDSGLLDEIIPPFEVETGHDVVVLVQPSGQLFRSAKDGSLDVLLTHHPRLEKAFLEDGFAIEVLALMNSRFVLLGPKGDPVGVRGLDIVSAFKRIEEDKPVFVTREDQSGTSDMENAIWSQIEGADTDFRIETGQGMGASLNIAQAMEAYVFSEIATFLNFSNKGNLEILVDEPEPLNNVYSLSRLNPERFDASKLTALENFTNYLQSDTAQDRIDNFTIAGKRVFHARRN